MAKEKTIQELMAREELITEKIDEKGVKWIKKYVGGGAHFENWLDQYKEIYGKDNVETEEIDSRGFKCFERGGEKMYRIWEKEKE